MLSRTIACCAALLALAATPPPMTAEQLVAKNLEARGGADKLAAIRTMHAVGKVRFRGSSEAKIELWVEAPDKVRSEFTLQGLTAVQAWDGTEGWTIQPFEGRRDPQRMSPDDAKDLIEAADVAGPLSDHAAKGNKIEYLGTEDVDGTEAYKLRVTLKNGDSQVHYLDPDYFLDIRIVYHRIIRGQEQVQTVDVGDYEKVDGIYFPLEVGRNQIEKAELNVPVDPALFAFPEGGAK